MGFSGKIVSDSSHYHEFVCVICQQLVDLKESWITRCAHVFCKTCMQHWMKQRQTCPTCQLDLSNRSTAAVTELKEGNPLAWRVLSRVRVECPLTCGWVGDYSELQPHLLNSSNHAGSANSGSTPRTSASFSDGKQDEPRMAGILQSQAAEKFTSQNFVDSLNLYTKSFETLTKAFQSRSLPEKNFHSKASEILSERASVYLVLGDNNSAFRDCALSLEHNLENTRAWLNMLRTFIESGELALCEALFHLFTSLEGKGQTEKNRKAVEDLFKEVKDMSYYQRELSRMLQHPEQQPSEEGRKNVLTLSQLLSSKSSNYRFLFLEARCNIEYGSITKGIRLGLSALKKSSNSKLVLGRTKAVQLLRGLCTTHSLDQKHIAETVEGWSKVSDLDIYLAVAEGHLYSFDLKEALKFSKRCLQLDPDFASAKMVFKKVKHYQKQLEIADAKSSKQDFASSEAILTDLVEVAEKGKFRIRADSPLAAQLLAERAAIKLRVNKLKEAMADANSAIYVQEDCRRAWLTKVYVYHAEGRFQEALDDLSTIMKEGFNSWGQNDSVLKGVFEKTKFLLCKSKRPDYYKILSLPEKEIHLSSVSSEPEIKAAYKKKALEVHPDRKPIGKEKQQAEKEFKLVGEAFEILADVNKRKLYDEGYDKEGIEEELKRRERYAHHH